MEKLGINLGFLIAQIINFAIIMVVLIAWVYKPLQNAMKKRNEKINQGIEDARIAADARANAEKDAQDLITEAQNKAVQIIREANEKAEAANKDVKAAGQAEIEKLRQSALADIAQAKEKELLGLRGSVATLAIAAAQKIIGETLDEKRQHALVNEFFSGIKSGKLVLLQDVEMNGKDAEITSALPLTDEERKTVSDDVLKKLGSDVQVTYSVKPEILGGLILRVGDKVVDASVANQIQNLRQSLN